MDWFIEFFVNCIYVLPKTSKGFSLPIKVRTGIPCSLNKVSNLPPCFFSSFLYCGGVYALLCVPRNVVLSYLSSFLSSKSNSSLTAHMMSGFCGEEIHSQRSLACKLFFCSRASACFSRLVSPHLPAFKAHVKHFTTLWAPWFPSPFNLLWSLSCVFFL